MDIKWIKIAVNIFDDEKILLIESMPEADAIIVIWFKLLALAGKLNNDGIFTMNGIPYTDEMFATIFRRPLNTVRLALDVFEKFGMVQIIRDTLTIPNWEKHQSTDKLDKIREQNRARQAAYRERQRLALEAPEESNVTEDVTSNVTVTSRNAIEEDIEEEREEELDNIKYIVDLLNREAGTNYRPSTEKTRRLIKARLKEGFTVENFETVIMKKAAEWKNDPKMAQYLRPETLFGTKFESYLNAPVRAAAEKTGWEAFANA